MSDAASYVTGQEWLVAGGSDLVNGLLDVGDHDRLPPFEGFHRTANPSVLDSPDDDELDPPEAVE